MFNLFCLRLTMWVQNRALSIVIPRLLDITFEELSIYYSFFKSFIFQITPEPINLLSLHEKTEAISPFGKFLTRPINENTVWFRVRRYIHLANHMSVELQVNTDTRPKALGSFHILCDELLNRQIIPTEYMWNETVRNWSDLG